MQSIYEPKGKAKEYCDLAINIYDSCNHGCTYCYARSMAKRFGREWGDAVSVRAGIVEATRAAAKKYTDREIQLCFTCDPYPADIDTTPTREVIKAIKESGNRVRILTKGGNRALRDLELLDSGDWFGVTLTGACENEPGAAVDVERYATIKEAHRRGIKTWVSFEPVYHDYIVYGYIQNSDCIDTYKIGKLNYAPSDIDWSAFGHECERLCKLHNRNYYIKDDLRNLMQAAKATA